MNRWIKTGLPDAITINILQYICSRKEGFQYVRNDEKHQKSGSFDFEG